MNKEDIEFGIERLKEIQTEIAKLVGEAEGIVRDCDYREWNSAREYWITRINAALDNKMEMWTMADTIFVLKALVE